MLPRLGVHVAALPYAASPTFGSAHAPMADAVKAADEALLAQLGYKQVRGVTRAESPPVAPRKRAACAFAKGHSAPTRAHGHAMGLPRKPA